jgi:hypothetical protein
MLTYSCLCTFYIFEYFIFINVPSVYNPHGWYIWKLIKRKEKERQTESERERERERERQRGRASERNRGKETDDLFSL